MIRSTLSMCVFVDRTSDRAGGRHVRCKQANTSGLDECHLSALLSLISAQLLGVSLLGVGAVLRLERDAWSMVNGQWSND